MIYDNRKYHDVRVAVLDLNNNTPNQGMRCIRELLANHSIRFLGEPLSYEVFDVRHKTEVPDPEDFDIFVSSGGPGSPYDGEGSDWERKYFGMVDKIWNHNQKADAFTSKKYVFFICHSYQMMCRFFNLGEVEKRRSTSFGIMPVHLTAEGKKDPVFTGLSNPFYAADFRDWQVIQPDVHRIEALGGKILCTEKIRPHVTYERATMAIRMSREIVGTQFHPEADAFGMKQHFLSPERKKVTIERHGEEKYLQILEHLDHPNRIDLTHRSIIPSFLHDAVTQLRGELQEIGSVW